MGLMDLSAFNLPRPIFCRATVSFLVSGSNCGQTGPKAVAERVSRHGVTVTGGMNLKDPRGGAANGIP